jgi:hypothetical protein
VIDSAIELAASECRVKQKPNPDRRRARAYALPMTWSEDLSGPHLRIAASDSSRIGVLAGPGTGKTSYGLMRRVARLLEEGVPPDEILLISFTRTAAHDLRTKVANLGVEGAEEVRATTLHAYCFGLLQRDAVLAITGRTPRPLLDHEVDMMLRDISGDFGTLAERRQRLRAYEAGWAREASAHPGSAEPEDDEFGRNVLRWLAGTRRCSWARSCRSRTRISAITPWPRNTGATDTSS